MRVLSTHSIHTTHSPETVFARWADPTSWPSWDTEVRSVSFDGPAAVGARGRMRPTHGPTTPFRVTAYQHNQVFSNTSSLPGAALTFVHIVTPTPQGATVLVEVRIDGLLAPLWQRILGPKLAHAAPASASGLIALLDAA